MIDFSIFIIIVIVSFVVLQGAWVYSIYGKENKIQYPYPKEEITYEKPKIRIEKIKTGHKCLNCGGVGFTNYKCDYCGSNLYKEEKGNYITSGYTTSGTCY